MNAITMKKSFFIGFVLLLIIPTVLAETSYVFKRGQDIDLKIPCFNGEYRFCDINTTCVLTVNKPDGSNLFQNGTMSYNSNYFNYSMGQSLLSDTGEYFSVMQCDDGNVSGYSTFIFEITPSGVRASEGNSIAMFVIIALLILLILINLYLTKFFADRQSGLAEFFFLGIFIFSAAALNVVSKIVYNQDVFNVLNVLYRAILYILFFLFLVILVRLTMRAVKHKKVKDNEADAYGDNIF